jgi:hypothetical protein
MYVGLLKGNSETPPTRLPGENGCLKDSPGHSSDSREVWATALVDIVVVVVGVANDFFWGRLSLR